MGVREILPEKSPQSAGMEFSELTGKIIGCAYNVYNKMGFGFQESVYENCMVIELAEGGLSFEAQKPIQVHYDGHPVGEFVADLLVEDTVVVELKSVARLAKAHEVQLVNYLVATGKPVGLLLNFGERGVQVKRKLRVLKR
jgi:GxxExxY protein